MAETRIAALQRLCPDAIRAVSLERQAKEGAAVGDVASYKLYREAARFYFRCSTTVSNSESQDMASFAYAYDMNLSTRTNGDVLHVNSMLDPMLNELAYRSKFKDIRDVAPGLRRPVRVGYREAYKTVNDHYPDDAPELPPASISAPVIPEYVGPTTVVSPSP